MSAANSIRRKNRPLLQLPDSHPARRFLDAFIKCLRHVGREIPYRGRELEAIDQEWMSCIDNKKWKFSSFAYTYLSFTLELDGWLTDAPTLTHSERNVLRALPRFRVLMEECREACVKAGNSEVLTMSEDVLELLKLWEECINARIDHKAPVL
jgi:hypothetical protein